MIKSYKFHFNLMFSIVWLCLFFYGHTTDVSLCAEVSSQETLTQQTWNKSIPRTPEYAAGEVLVKFKEGAEPQTILKEVRLEVKNVQRIHSLNQATGKFKKNLELQKDKGGWFWFLDKKYKAVNDIPDEELFKAAYSEMSSAEKALYRTYKIQLPEGMTVEEVVLRLKENPNVEYAEPNYIVKIQMVPNDPYYNSSGTWEQPYDDLWGLKKIQCEQAWDISQGEGVVVAVIDTGVDYNHEDIAQNIWINPGEDINHNGIVDPEDFNGMDDDGNGYIDDIRGWDFAYADNDPMDGNGHGTHVAGTIAAVGNNNMGIIGVAPKAKIMILKGFDTSGSGSISNAVSCIEYAAENGAHILNNSWGAYAQSQFLEDAFTYAHSVGCINIAAAGNNNTDVSSFTPANLPTVISVAASDHNNQRSVWNLGLNSASNYGVKIDVSAPGGGDSIWAQSGSDLVYDILSSMPNDSYIATERPYLKVSDGYYRLAGTSMACPHVSGVAALVLSHHMEFTNEEIRHIIRRTAEDICDQGWDFYAGYGRVNALAAINDSTRLDAQITSPLHGVKIWGRVNIIGTAGGADFQYYTLECGEGNNPSIWHTIVTGVQEPVTNGILYAGWDTSLVKDGICTIRLLVSNGTVISEERRILEVDNINIIYPENINGASYIEDSARGGDSIAITGRVASPALDYYRIYYRERGTSTWYSEGITLLNNNGTTPVVDQPLAIWDTTTLNLSELKHYEIKLEASTATNTSIEYANLILDPQFKSGWPRKINGSCSKPEIVDLDRDGLKEIIVAVSPNQIYVFKPDGTLKKGWPVLVNSEQSAFGWYTPLVVGDLDGDGDLEIVVAESNYPAKIHAFHQDGTYVNGWPIQTSDSFNSLPILADLDGEPGLELIIAGDITLFAYKGNGIALNGFPIHSDNYLADTLAVGDLDRDGTKEIIAISYDKIMVFKNDGTMLQGWPVEHIKEDSFNNGNYSAGFGMPLLGDIDGDGDLEIVLGFQASYYDNQQNRDVYGMERIYIYHHTGQLVANWPIDVDEYMLPYALADFNSDGYLEIITNAPRRGPYDPTKPGEYDSDGKVYIFDYQGNLLSGWPRILPYGGNNPIVSDISGDGKADIIVPGYNNPGYWVYSGLITFFTQTGDDIGSKEVAKAIRHVTVDDIDGDGEVELIAEGGRNLSDDIFIWELDALLDVNSMFWPTYQHDMQHTGCYTTPNSPPILNPIGNKKVKEGQVLTFTISATDPNGDTLTYSAANLPTGAIFNPQTRTFTWRPTYTQAGTYNNIHFEVTDSQLTDSEDITIRVINVNDPPILYPIGNKRVQRLQCLRFRVHAKDPDNDKITYRIINKPNGASLDPNTGWFSWIPKITQVGNFIVTFIARDILGNEDSETITITIPNAAPILYHIGNKTVHPGQCLIFKLIATDPDIIDRYFLNYYAEKLPQGAFLNRNTGLFSWRPTLMQRGTYRVRFYVKDPPGAMDDETITITVR